MAKLEPHPLMRTIVDHPDLDPPRLVYADWLDEQGHPQLAFLAEYIRLKIERANTPHESEQARSLDRRTWELVEQAGDVPHPPMPAWTRAKRRRGEYSRVLTARGLPHCLECTFKRFARGAEVLEFAPIVQVELGDCCDPAVTPFAAAAALARKELIRVRELTVRGRLDADAFAALAANPNVSNLRKLDFQGLAPLSVPSAQALASAAPRFTALKELTMHSWGYPDGAGDILRAGFASQAYVQISVSHPPEPQGEEPWYSSS